MNTALQIIAVILLIGGSAFFSAAEMAISSANRTRLSSAAEDGSRAAARAVKILDRYDDALSAILIGNNLCNVASDSLVTVIAMALLGSRYNALASVLITLFMTVVIIICSESAPKIAAKKNANRWSTAFSGILRLLMLILKPVILLVSLLIRLLTFPLKGEQRESSEEEAAAELESIIETVEDEGVIDEERSELLQAALDFSEIPVMDVMTARVDVQAIDIDEPCEELLLGDSDDIYSRIPVFEGSMDNILGVLHLNRFYRARLENPAADIRSMLLDPPYFYKTVRLSDALSQFRRTRQHMGIVTDEYGGTLGIVTLEDVLEQLVGEIYDENDEEEPATVENPDGTFEVDGDMPIAAFAELVGIPEDDLATESATAGGWTMEKNGGFPTAGDVISAEGIIVTVLSMDEDGHRVERLKVKKEQQ